MNWDDLATAAEKELFGNILPLWTSSAVDRTRGGFFGRINNDMTVDPDAPKGLVMHARLLWSFSAVRRFRDSAEYRDTADHALGFLRDRLADPINGGYWWKCDSDGNPADRNKVVYGQAFALYGMSEALRLPGVRDPALRQEAEKLFSLMERHARDCDAGGYREILSEDWSPHPDGRLSPVDIPCFKSMNTNLHVLEAYGNYYRVRPEPVVAEALESLLRWFMANIVDSRRGHLRLFLDENGTSMKDTDSYGHDIEAAWLLREAAVILGNRDLEKEMEPALSALAETVLAEGYSLPGGGLDYERDGSHRDTDRHWWVQAEATVGYRDRWEKDGDSKWLEAAEQEWKYIRESIVDGRNGEWLWGRQADGTVMAREKGGLWKTPYHNGRACMELMERIKGETHE